MPALALLSSTTLRDLEVLGEIGRGSRAVVYRARHDGQTVALKVYERGRGEDGHIESRFVRELEVLGLMRHPSILRPLAAGHTEGRPYLVTDFIAGRTLATRLRRGPLPLSELTAVARSLAKTLSVVHRRGVVHRDVKPSNVMLGDDSRLWLIDFDLAAPIGTRDELVVGTLPYSSPEQLGMLERPVDERSDLYGLGALLFEAATGRVPFVGSEAEVMRAHASELPPDPRSLRDDLGAAWSSIVVKLLAKDPNDRYQSADGLLRDLDQLLPELREVQGVSSLAVPSSRSADRRSTREPTPFVGRREHRAKVEHAIEQARRGRGSVLAVRGREGSGRTRLLQEIGHGLRAEAGVLISAAATAEDEPLAALRRAMRMVVRELRQHARATALRTELTARLADYGPFLAHFEPELGRYLGATARRPHEHEEISYLDGIAMCFVAVAEVNEVALLHLDDAQWLDDASCRVLRRLCVRIDRLPLVIAMTTCASNHEPPGGIRVFKMLGGAKLEEVSIPALALDEVAAIASQMLGGDTLEPKTLRLLATRAAGLPLGVELQLRGLLERGLLTPQWGVWQAETEAIEHAELPVGLEALILARVAELGPATRRVLVRAAVIGLRFDRELLGELPGTNPADIDGGLAEAVDAGIVTDDEGEYVFAHEQIVDALTSSLEPEERGEIHHAIAEALQMRSGDIDVFALARHRNAGSTGRDPRGTYEANLAAGQQAFEGYSYADAHRFLTRAIAVAEANGLPLDRRIDELLGESCRYIGDMKGAVTYLGRAIDSATRPVARAKLRGTLAEVYMAHVDLEQAWSETLAGYQELGRPFPLTRFGLGSTSTFQWALGLVVNTTGWGFGSADGERREELCVVTHLLELTQGVAYLREQTFELIQTCLRQLYVAQLIGPSRELVRAYSGYAFGMAAIGWRKSSAQFRARAKAIAEQLGDRQMLGRCMFYEGMTLNVLGNAVQAAATHRENLQVHGSWLEPADYVRACGDLGWLLCLRGYVEEGAMWLQRGIDRAVALGWRDDVARDHHCVAYLLGQLPVLGRFAEAEQLLHGFRAAAETRCEPWRWHLLHGYEIAYHVERRDFGRPLETAIEALDALAIDPKRAQFHRRNFFVYKAYARLAQAFKDPERMDAAEQAVEQLGLAANITLLRAHEAAARGALVGLRGDAEGSEREFERAERFARDVDGSWVLFQVAMFRAYLHQRRGEEEQARREANAARTLAGLHGWTSRARLVESEFKRLLVFGSFSGRDSSHHSTSSRASERQLEALLQVSQSAGSVLEPSELATIVLDEVVRIFGAERAFLFLQAEDGDGLRLWAGRASNRRDIPELRGFSRTVVDQVWRRNEPVVLRGTDDGEELGAESIMAHALRSVMAAPLSLRDEAVGVVYVDTRLAEGMFTDSDATILTAIARHIPVALETARAAQLEVQVQSERAHRNLAERLRVATVALGSTLEVGAVLERLLDGLAQLIGFDRAHAVLREHDERPAIGVTRGFDGVEPTVHPGIWSALERDPLTTSLPWIESWRERIPALDHRLVLGLKARHGLMGVVVLERSVGEYGPQQRGLGSAFVAHASAAVDNARLFATVERLATIDDLTGVANRRHFFARADEEFARSRRYGHPLTVMMIDVDHFKGINDRFGHACGDEVLRVVADVCRQSVRDLDSVGRYGGEEFAVLLPHADGDQGAAVAERMRSAVEAIRIATAQGSKLEVTISTGVATADASVVDLHRLLNNADAALYRAKASGRNRVCLWSGTIASS